jgi:hypothetical protein
VVKRRQVLMAANPDDLYEHSARTTAEPASRYRFNRFSQAATVTAPQDSKPAVTVPVPPAKHRRAHHNHYQAQPA